LQGLEAEIDAAVARRLSRGSIIVTVRFADTSANAAAQINTNAIQRYLEQLLSIPGLNHESARVDIGALIALPGVVIHDTGEKNCKALARCSSALSMMRATSCRRCAIAKARCC
jgi:uncharacterized protein YicC (UPF0701 family)